MDTQPWFVGSSKSPWTKYFKKVTKTLFYSRNQEMAKPKFVQDFIAIYKQRTPSSLKINFKTTPQIVPESRSNVNPSFLSLSPTFLFFKLGVSRQQHPLLTHSLITIFTTLLLLYVHSNLVSWKEKWWFVIFHMWVLVEKNMATARIVGKWR